MTRRLSLVSSGLLLAALGIFAAAPQKSKPQDKVAEAARLNNIGAAYMNQQLFEKALKAFQQAQALDPKLTVASLNQGIALLNLGRVEPAKKLLEDAVKQNPDDPNAWYNLGLLEKNSSDADAAVEAFHHVTEIDPNDADAWYFLGTTYAQLKQYPQAIEAFQHAVKLNPLHASAEFGMSRAYQQSGDTATAREHLKRFQYITQNKLGSPISLAYGEQGQYSRVEESKAAVEKVPPAIPVKFVDVTAAAGLVTKPDSSAGNDLASYLGPGACFLDYDGDGKTDIFLPDDGPMGGEGLYHNLGNGKFEDVTKQAGLDPESHGIGCTAGDYDSDGFPDLVVSFNGKVLLLHNEKNGTFKDATKAAGIASPEFDLGVTFVDYDHDGDLDLYITRFINQSAPAPGQAISLPYDQLHQPNLMFRNNGNSTFTNVTDAVGLSGPGPSVAAVGADTNNDRAVDLVVTGWSQSPVIYENPREGKFNALPLSQAGGTRASAGIATLDFDHDGWTDLASTQCVFFSPHPLAQPRRQIL